MLTGDERTHQKDRDQRSVNIMKVQDLLMEDEKIK